MDRGRIRQVGTPTQVYEYPKSRFVADFIGSINMLDGRVAGLETTTARVELPELGTVEARAIPGLAAGQPITLAIRPEKIAISRDHPNGPNAVEGVVEDLGYFGKDSLYRVRLASGRILSVLATNARRVGETERVAQWEDRVWLAFDPSAAILLAGEGDA
jgi:putrescine transport system ATP-binding protein